MRSVPRISDMPFHGYKLTVAVVAVILIALCLQAGDFYSTLMLSRGNPKLAYQLNPQDGQAIGRFLNFQLRNEQSVEIDDETARNIRLALRSEPLDRTLLRSLAIKADLEGDSQRAYAMMSLSNRVSRRDLIGQLWLGEFFAREGNKNRVLTHYIAAMKVSPKVETLVLPRLVKMLSDRNFRQYLVPYIQSEDSWGPALVSAASNSDLTNAVPLVKSLTTKIKEKRFEAAIQHLLYRLLLDGRTKDFVTLARQAYPRFDYGQFRDISFNNMNTEERFAKLSWFLVNNVSFSTEVARHGTLRASAQPYSSGIVAARYQIVTPSTSYQLSYRTKFDDPNSGIALAWTGTCIGKEGEARIMNARSLINMAGVYRDVDFTTSSGCHLLRLELALDGAENPSIATVDIFGLELFQRR